MAWRKKILRWVDGKVAYVSVVFTWDLEAARQYAMDMRNEGYDVVAGGPAVSLMPEYLSDVAECGGVLYDTVFRHNREATFTSRGCIRSCPFCAVPRTEGGLIELDDWPVRPLICDNNLLACSRHHFDSVIDKLKQVARVDFNQGLDCRCLTKYHAERLAELDCVVRLAWDDTNDETQFWAAYEKLRSAGFSTDRIRVYVLIGFNDTPEDALYRLQSIWDAGSFPNPMRYQPLDVLTKNSFVSSTWTDHELKRYMRYWSRLFWFSVRYKIPFEEFEG